MSEVKLDFPSLQEAVYQLRKMEIYAQEINGVLSNAVGALTEMAVAGNFKNKIICAPETGGAVTGGLTTAGMQQSNQQITYEVNQSLEKTTTEETDSDSVIGIARIALKMRDLCLLIEVSHQLISRTILEMEGVDNVIARLALDMYLQNPELSAEEREYYETHYDETVSAIEQEQTKTRLEQEAKVKETFGQGQETVKEPIKEEEITDDEIPE